MMRALQSQVMVVLALVIDMSVKMMMMLNDTASDKTDWDDTVGVVVVLMAW